jgi:hypothetical protein
MIPIALQFDGWQFYFLIIYKNIAGRMSGKARIRAYRAAI